MSAEENAITEDEIIKAEQKWGSSPSTPELQFCLATLLVKSSLASKIKRAIQLFHELRLQEKYISESYYYTALGHFSLGDLIEARIWTARLLRLNANHSDGLALKTKIDQAIVQHRKHRAENLANSIPNGQAPVSPSNSKSLSNIVVDTQRRRTIIQHEDANDATSPDTPSFRYKKNEKKITRFVLDELISRFSQEEIYYLVRCFHNMDSASPLSNKPITNFSPAMQNNLIDRLQLGFAMNQLGNNPDQNELFFKCLFNGFFGVSKRLLSRDENGATEISTRNLRSKTIFLNYWQKHSVAAVECIDLETFLAGMSILSRGTVEERGTFAFDMLDSNRQGYLQLSDFERIFESVFTLLTDINVDMPTNDHKSVAKQVFKFLDVHKTGKITIGQYIKGLKKDPYFMASLNFRPPIDKIPRFTMPICQRRGTLCTFGSKTWSSCLYLMQGMRSILSMTKPLTRDIKKEDFMVEMRVFLPRVHNPDATPFEVTDTTLPEQDSILFLDYAPHVFQKLRESRGISESEYLHSISPEQMIGHLLCGQLTSLSEQLSEGSGGRSGASFYYTWDGKFIIKQISSEEFANFRRTLPDYYYYMMQNPDSIVSQFFGCFEFENMGFVVMRNVFSTAMPIHEIYDLKGSKVSRSSPDGPVYKDLDLHGQKINIGTAKALKRDRVYNCVVKDVNFLQQLKFTDYSILLGIHFVDGYDKSQRLNRLSKKKHSQPREEDLESEGDGDLMSFQEMIMAMANGDLKSASFKDLKDLGTHTEYDPSDDEDTEYKRKHRNSDIEYCESTVHDFYEHLAKMKREEKKSRNKSSKSIFEGGLTSADGKEIYFLGIIDTLTEFTIKKNAELNLKTLKYPLRRNEISAQPPAEYADRLKKFIGNLII